MGRSAISNHALSVKVAPQFTLREVLSQHSLVLGSACLFGALSALCSLGPNILIYWFSIHVLNDQLTMQLAYFIAGGLLLSILGRNMLFAASTYISHMCAFNIQATLRLKMFHHLAKVEMGYFSRIDESDLRKTILDDLEIIEDTIAHIIPELTSILVGPLVIMSIMFFIDWRLTVACLIPLLVAFIFMGLMSKRCKVPTQQYFKATAKLTSAIGEMVRCMPLIRAFNLSETALNKVNASNADYYSVVKKWISVTLLPSNIFFVFSTASPIFVLSVGCLFYAQQMVSRDVLILFLCLSIGISNFFILLMELAQRLEKHKEALRRIKSLFSEPYLANKSDFKQINTNHIEFKNVSYRYDQKKVLNNISLKISPGETIGIVGHSGSGKSTLIRCLLRFFDLAEGEITIGGIDIKNIPLKQLHDQTSYVFQDTFLFCSTIADNLRIAKADATKQEIIRAAQAAGAHDFIMQLAADYDTKLGENGTVLSGGERQRLSIARAFLKNAPILILDEATSHIDMDMRCQVQQALSRLAVDRTVIIVGHHLAALRNCDKILVLNEGELSDYAPHSILIDRNKYYQELWQAEQMIETFSFDHYPNSKENSLVDAEVVS